MRDQEQSEYVSIRSRTVDRKARRVGVCQGLHALLRTMFRALLLTSGTGSRSIVQWVYCSTSLAGGQHAVFEPILQWVHRHTATHLVSIVGWEMTCWVRFTALLLLWFFHFEPV